MSSTVAQDALRRLEERVERASVAAERLFSDAAAQATSAALKGRGTRRDPAGGADAAPGGADAAPANETGEPAAGTGAGGAPPQGWASAQERQTPRPPGDLELLITALEAVGELVPPDLRHRLGEAVREVLLAVRALIDWYLDRSESGSGEPPDVQDIPVQ
jgi:hypothetical protein